MKIPFRHLIMVPTSMWQEAHKRENKQKKMNFPFRYLYHSYEYFDHILRGGSLHSLYRLGRKRGTFKCNDPECRQQEGPGLMQMHI